MGRRKNFSYDEILTMRKKNIGGVIHPIKTKDGYSGYEDVLLSIFSNGLYTQIRSANVALDVSQQIRNLVFDNNPTAYFAALDAIAQTGPTAVVPVVDADLDIYYNLPGTATINILSGTQFTSSNFSGFASGAYMLIPSTYLINIDGYTYQTLGTRLSATLRIISPLGITQIIPFIDIHPKFKIDCFTKDLKQDYIHIIFKTKGYYDPLYIYYKLISNILGGNMSSRLFVEIREKLGLVYSIKCETTNYEETGFFDIYTQNETKDTIKCIESILKELIKIKENLISEIELEENKKNYCDIHITKFDDIEDEIEHYSRFILTNRPIETLDMRINSINNITALDIKNVSRELFDFNKVHIITFGKATKTHIEKLLNKYSKISH